MFAKKNKMVIMLLLVMLITVMVPSFASANTGGSETRESWSGKMFDVNVSPNDGSVTLEGLETEDDTWRAVMDQLKYFLGGFAGIAVILIVGALIIQAVKLGGVGDNPNKRKEITAGIGWTLVAAALLGSVGTIIAIAYKFL